VLEILICEDNVEYLNELSDYISRSIQENNIPGKIVSKTTNPIQVLEYFKSNNPNVLFLDIDLSSKINGIDLALKLKEEGNRPYIVYISEHLECVFSAIKTRIFDFLPKPVTYNKVKGCILDIYKDYLNANKQCDKEQEITIKLGATIYNIKKDDIVYIEKLQNKAIIHNIDKIITCYETLEYFTNLFDNDSSFVRCHKSFIANKNHISEIRMNKLEILFKTGHVCYIGKKYKGELINV
jgi:two-component system response regulator AgrA